MKYLKKFESHNKADDIIEAAERGDIEAVKELISAGVNLDKQDNGGNTALIWASYNNHIEIVKELIKAGAHLDKVNDDGNTALLLASIYNNIEIVKELLENFADEFIIVGGKSFYDFLDDENKKIIQKLYPNEVENALRLSGK